MRSDRRAFLARLAQTLSAAGLSASGILGAKPLSVGTATFKPEPGAPALHGLSRKAGAPIAGGYVDDDTAIGHALRDGVAIPSAGRARETRRVSVAVVGGGIGGLSAGWRLDALGMRDWLVLELAPEAGGNSRSGENTVSRFPWGAHYLPVPDTRAEHVRTLLREVGVLGADGRWDERTLCHSPQERIWQHGRWHEGLAPLDAAPAWEREEWRRFDAQVAQWRSSDAFHVPLTENRGGLSVLDRQTGADWFADQGYRSPTLRWWLNYGTRDDYGTSLDRVSAWATAHYFSARPASEEGPLTWPEGNGFLVRYLAQRAGARVIPDAAALRVARHGARWRITTPTLDVDCDVVIWAAPLFLLPYVMPEVQLPVSLEYAPWVVANLTLSKRPAERGAAPAWDNVFYNSPSLGYVSATHQFLGRPGPQTVWTWYHAVVDRPAVDARRWMSRRPWSGWRDEILADLGRAHPDIAANVSRASMFDDGAMPWCDPCLAFWRGARGWPAGSRPRACSPHTLM
jgi:hypothetical protein